jgi:hypothetical protein
MTISTVNQDRWEIQMTFTVIKKNHVGRPKGFVQAAPVQVAKWAKSAGSIMLSAEILGQLGWAAKDRIEVSIGSGTDNGLIALRRASEGYVLTLSGASKKQARINCIHILAHIAKSPSTTCKYQILRDTLYVQLPARLMAPEAREVETVYRAPAFTNGQLVAAE